MLAAIRQRKKGEDPVDNMNYGSLPTILPLTGTAAASRSAHTTSALKSSTSCCSIETKGFNYLDGCLSIMLLLLGLFTRLFNVTHPRGVVFDEAHFTKFTNWYVSGKYYLDIHPPLAKLAMAAFMKYVQGIDLRATHHNISTPQHNTAHTTQEHNLNLFLS